MKKLITIFLSALCIITQAATIICTCITVYDGDTIKVQDEDGGKYKIRFADIDAPEKDQPFGKESKEFLSNMILNKKITVHFKQIDMYGRIVGMVFLGDLYVNAEMVRNGLAWHYKAYSKDDRIGELESNARQEKKGLWMQQNPQPPWEYRKKK